MTKTTTNKQRAALLRKFHGLIARTGVGTEGKEVILSNYGVTSAAQLNTTHLIEACNLLEGTLTPSNETDKLRKRLMAAIGGWLRATNQGESTEKIKAIACRAAKRDDFNKIPNEQLRSLYSAFCKKVKDLQQVQELTAEQINKAITLN